MINNSSRIGSRRRRIRLFIRFALVCGLLFWFGLQVRDGFYKFIKRQTTVASSAKTFDSGLLPALSFCPGYKGGDYYDVYDELLTFMKEDDYPSAKEWWLNETYDVGEVLAAITHPLTGWVQEKETRINRTGRHRDLRAEIHEMGTNYGRCYTLYFDWRMMSTDFYSLLFDLSAHERMLLYFHERGDEVGLNWGFWPRIPVTAEVRRGDVVTVTVTRNYFMALRSVSSCEESEDYSYPDCVMRWARDRYRELFKIRNGTACWHPYAKNLAVGSGFPPCKTEEEHLFAANMAYFDIIQYLTNQTVSGCLNECRRQELELQTLTEPEGAGLLDKEEEKAYVHLELSMTSEYKEQVFLYDFNTILSLIGGSLGLFLGVSMFTTLMYLSEKLLDYCFTRRGLQRVGLFGKSEMEPSQVTTVAGQLWEL